MRRLRRELPRWKGKPSALITAAEIRRSTIIKSASAVSAVRKCAASGNPGKETPSAVGKIRELFYKVTGKAKREVLYLKPDKI